MQWYDINDLNDTDTPALVVYKERVSQNIARALQMVKSPAKLRPHVKTNKMAEVCKMMIVQGITRFKCATIAEAEMLGLAGAPDVLMAYQPVGPKAGRLQQVIMHYPGTHFSCLIDDFDAASHLSSIFSAAGMTLDVYIDLNTGMNRTGVLPTNAADLLEKLLALPSLKITGIHAYDGHITESDLQVRKAQSDAAYQLVDSFRNHFERITGRSAVVVAGGSGTFPTHLGRDVECSPGTFVFWDWGYQRRYTDQPFEIAALVLTRIISIVNDTILTTDLGYKSLASESPLPRVHFLNLPDAKVISQSEEHLTIEVQDTSIYSTGDVLYGVPVHICPTVALYEKATVIENNQVTDSWKVIARNRTITY